MEQVQAKTALRYYLENAERIDPAEMIKNFAKSEPAAFLDFLSRELGRTPASITGQICKYDPATFLKLAQFENRHFEACKEIMQLMRNQQKIPAIKLARTAWNFGLKEAKDVIDQLHEMLCDRNELPGVFKAGMSVSDLSEEQYHALNMITDHF